MTLILHSSHQSVTCDLSIMLTKQVAFDPGHAYVARTLARFSSYAKAAEFLKLNGYSLEMALEILCMPNRQWGEA